MTELELIIEDILYKYHVDNSIGDTMVTIIAHEIQEEYSDRKPLKERCGIK